MCAVYLESTPPPHPSRLPHQSPRRHLLSPPRTHFHFISIALLGCVCRVLAAGDRADLPLHGWVTQALSPPCCQWGRLGQEALQGGTIFNRSLPKIPHVSPPEAAPYCQVGIRERNAQRSGERSAFHLQISIKRQPRNSHKKNKNPHKIYCFFLGLTHKLLCLFCEFTHKLLCLFCEFTHKLLCLF